MPLLKQPLWKLTHNVKCVYINIPEMEIKWVIHTSGKSAECVSFTYYVRKRTRKEYLHWLAMGIYGIIGWTAAMLIMQI